MRVQWRGRLGGRNIGHLTTLHPKREMLAGVQLPSSFSFSLSPWDGITHISPVQTLPLRRGWRFVHWRILAPVKLIIKY